jgi:Methyltransferase domain
MINKSLIEAAEVSPNLLQRPSAWLGHLPFASWLVKEFKPRCLVELGTHYGHSYFSFCQAASELSETFNFYAVDTWQGDEHAGIYDGTIYDEVNENNKKYSKFSTLLRMTFDEAADHFLDGSVDLLHIDGLHTYEAVKHDFDKWFPKLSAGAIVLFHDTNVRDKDFGVWKFWAELCEIYPNNIEFMHSYGLGVIQINNCDENKLLNWLKPGSSDRKNIKEYFSAIGMRQIDRYRLIELEEQIHSLNCRISEIQKDHAEFLVKVYHTKSWRYTSWLRFISGLLRRNK